MGAFVGSNFGNCIITHGMGNLQKLSYLVACITELAVRAMCGECCSVVGCITELAVRAVCGECCSVVGCITELAVRAVCAVVL